MKARYYTFSECITIANENMERAFAYGCKSSHLWQRIADEKANNAAKWFEMAKVASWKMDLLIRIAPSGQPIEV